MSASCYIKSAFSFQTQRIHQNSEERLRDRLQDIPIFKHCKNNIL